MISWRQPFTSSAVSAAAAALDGATTLSFACAIDACLSIVVLSWPCLCHLRVVSAFLQSVCHLRVVSAICLAVGSHPSFVSPCPCVSLFHSGSKQWKLVSLCRRHWRELLWWSVLLPQVGCSGAEDPFLLGPVTVFVLVLWMSGLSSRKESYQVKKVRRAGPRHCARGMGSTAVVLISCACPWVGTTYSHALGPDQILHPAGDCSSCLISTKIDNKTSCNNPEIQHAIPLQ